MADPTLRLTYNDYRIRIAEFLGVAYYGADGTEAAQLPVNAQDLDKVGRLFHDAYRRFWNDNEEGWNFSKVNLTLTFGSGTVSSDDARYYLPDDFPGVLLSDQFTWAAGTAFPPIKYVSDDMIREMQSSANSTGTPQLFTVRPINTTGASTGSRWEAVFWPTPSGTETVTAPYERYPALLTDGQVPVSGFQHDATLLEACLAQAELSVGDQEGPHERAYQRLLKQSIRLDRRGGPRRLGDYGDRSESRGFTRRPKSYYGVDTFDGVSVD